MKPVAAGLGNHPPVVLASASPRRRELLGLLGLSFTVVPADVDEALRDGESPTAFAIRLAEWKARAVAEHVDTGLTIGADTIVVLAGEVLGKPADEAQAAAYLRRLRGREHHVVTAVAVANAGGGRIESGYERTSVWMRDYTDNEIAAYIASDDPFDKAGAYAIQHTGFHPVERLEGSRTNVIGLPLGLVRQLLDRLDVIVSVEPQTDWPWALRAIGKPAIESGHGPEGTP